MIKKTELLYTPSSRQIADTLLHQKLAAASKISGVNMQSYDDLHRWSVSELGTFWKFAWDECAIIGDAGAAPYYAEGESFDKSRFFPKARLNFAENLLAPRRREEIAVIFQGENYYRSSLTYGQLSDEVSRMSQYLTNEGVKPGDRVVTYLPNMPETLIIFLACVAIGGVFSSASPDFGAKGVLERFGQIEPKIFFASKGTIYGGKLIDLTEKTKEIVDRLVASLKAAVIVDWPPDNGIACLSDTQRDRYRSWKEALSPYAPRSMTYQRFAFDHPLCVMYSSGTTGKPKCIKHRAGGVLLKQRSEHMFNCDIRPADRVFYFSTCGWMMWNWLITALAARAAVLLYDGSPLYPRPETLLTFLDENAVTFLGTSAKFIDTLAKLGIKPQATFTELRILASTGSPLSVSSFDYVYKRIKSNVCVSSISGGTDILGCFVGGNPIGPVYSGECQKACVGMDVRVYNEFGQRVVGEKGELICAKPFPSQPLGFWNDPDDVKYRETYYKIFTGVWTHGDFIEQTERGGFVFHGRSDTTLNPGGIRIGSAEIYATVESFTEVLESLVVGQNHGNDTRIVLFVRLRAGVEWGQDLITRIKQKIRSENSPRHVPAVIVSVTDIPRTKSGKIAEMAARQIIHGEEIKNKEALANPESLEEFANALKYIPKEG